MASNSFCNNRCSQTISLKRFEAKSTHHYLSDVFDTYHKQVQAYNSLVLGNSCDPYTLHTSFAFAGLGELWGRFWTAVRVRDRFECGADSRT